MSNTVNTEKRREQLRDANRRYYDRHKEQISERRKKQYRAMRDAFERLQEMVTPNEAEFLRQAMIHSDAFLIVDYGSTVKEGERDE